MLMPAEVSLHDYLKLQYLLYDVLSFYICRIFYEIFMQNNNSIVVHNHTSTIKILLESLCVDTIRSKNLTFKRFLKAQCEKGLFFNTGNFTQVYLLVLSP